MTTTEHPHHWFEEDGHLSREAFDTLAERAPVPGSVRSHLAGCAACSTQVAELRAVIALLQDAPDLAPGRSFQIPAPAAARTTSAPARPSFLDQLQGMLTPYLPALRAATVAVFLLFVSVTAAEFWSDGNESLQSDSAPESPALATSIATSEFPARQEAAGAQPTDEPLPAADEESESDSSDAASEIGPPPAAADSAETSADTAVDDPSGNAGPAIEMEPFPATESEVEPGTSLGAMQAMPAATPLEPATPEAVEATPLPSESEPLSTSSDDGWTIWRVAQAALLVLFVLLLVTILWLRQSRKSRAGTP